MIFIPLKYEYSKVNAARYRVHHQLKFGKPVAGYRCINYDMTEAEENLTDTENLVDAPSNVGCCQGTVKLLNLI